jgi:hypothetical protein
MSTPSNPGWVLGFIPTATQWNAEFSTKVDYPASPSQGGTGITSAPANGQILIGNGSGYSLSAITPGTGITITNGAGTVTISAQGSTPIRQASNYTATSGQIIYADTSAGVWTLTLPASGGTVTVVDYANSWGTNPLTINGNGTNILGASTYTADVSGYQLSFSLIGSVWKYNLSQIFG